jgi:hypothetical protein
VTPPHQHGYLAFDLPDEFVLEHETRDGGWIDHGRYNARDFQRLDDGAYVCSAGGSPTWLRCLRRDGDVLTVADGAGRPYRARIVPFPGGGYHRPA